MNTFDKFTEEVIKLKQQPLSGSPRFLEIIVDMAKLYNAKNNDYSDGNPLGNLLECEKAGIDPFDGLLARITDKYSRICNLNIKRKSEKDPEVKDETLKDTLKDLAVYSIMGIILLEHLDKVNSHDIEDFCKCARPCL